MIGQMGKDKQDRHEKIPKQCNHCGYGYQRIIYLIPQCIKTYFKGEKIICFFKLSLQNVHKMRKHR